MTTPFVLSIAGFDPSAGAGVVADCKTVEALDGIGLGVVTALTAQNEQEVRLVSWRRLPAICEELDCLAACYTPAAIKIGIVQNAEMLRALCEQLQRLFPAVPIVWDPVLRATVGHPFFEGDIEAIPWHLLRLVTPNRDELIALARSADVHQAIDRLSAVVAVYAKSCSVEADSIVNRFWDGDSEQTFEVPLLKGCEKHGSGCVLSAAIATQIAKGLDLPEAIRVSEIYMRGFLGSRSGLLGKHGAYA